MLGDILKSDVRTETTCKNNYHYWLGLWIGRVDHLKFTFNFFFSRSKSNFNVCKWLLGVADRRLAWKNLNGNVAIFFKKKFCNTAFYGNCQSLVRKHFLRVLLLLIHSDNPKSRLVWIIVFAHVVRPSVRPHYSNLEKQNNRKQCYLLAWLWTGLVDHWWLLSCLI